MRGKFILPLESESRGWNRTPRLEEQELFFPLVGNFDSSVCLFSIIH